MNYATHTINGQMYYIWADDLPDGTGPAAIQRAAYVHAWACAWNGRHVINRPDGSARLVLRDGTCHYSAHKGAPEFRRMQSDLERAERRAEFLRVAFGASGNTLARVLLAQGYEETWASPEIGMGPLWAESELAHLQTRSAMLRERLAWDYGSAGTHADDIKRARRRALGRARSARSRAKVTDAQAITERRAKDAERKRAARKSATPEQRAKDAERKRLARAAKKVGES